MEGLWIETIEDKLLNDLNIEKEFKIDEIKNIEIKLEELKIPKKKKKKVNSIRESIIPEKYSYHFLRHKDFCDFYQFKINKSRIIFLKNIVCFTFY